MATTTLDEVHSAGALVARIDKRLEAARTRRDTAVRAALADGHSLSTIATLSGLSRSGVLKIGRQQ